MNYTDPKSLSCTVVIPTYNGEKRLAKVLDRIKAQENVDSIFWETIVIDNNSDDRTAEIVRAYQKNWLTSSPLIYYFEPRRGTAFARQRAVEEARGELIGFLDDDNLPRKDWLSKAVRFALSHPKAGAYGSHIEGLFEREPDFDIQKISSCLAIIDRGDREFLYLAPTKILPPSAGLVVRREAWLNAVPSRLVLNYTGRGESMASEDIEALIHLQKRGWEIWHNPAMRVEHDIPGWRLERDYLLSVMRCIGSSRHHLRMIRLKGWQKPFWFLLYFVNDLGKLLLHTLKYGDRVREDVILACERELLKSTLISPCFLQRKKREAEKSV